MLPILGMRGGFSLDLDLEDEDGSGEVAALPTNIKKFFVVKHYGIMFQVAKLYMVSWSRAEDSEEARHVIDNTGKVNVEIKKIISFLQARDISDVLAELREELGQEVESKQAKIGLVRNSQIKPFQCVCWFG